MSKSISIITKATWTSPQARLLAASGLLAAFSSGCAQEPLCPELGACGGPPPSGSWVLSPGHGSCSEDLYSPPADTRVLGGEVPTARNAPIEPALFDWCDLLVTSGGKNIQRRSPAFIYESGPIGRTSLSYTPDPTDPRRGQYTLGTTRTGTYTLDLPAVCMREFGAMDDRQALDASGMPVGPPTNVCKQIEPQIAAAGSGEGSYPNVLCEPNPDELAGCLCYFDVSETGGGTGSYQLLDSHTIMHLPYSNFPQKVTYCNKGSELQLTGANGSYLFGVKGLRTMNLAASQLDPCTDGVQGGDETGVDCGGSCPTACAAPPAAAPAP